MHGNTGARNTDGQTPAATGSGGGGGDRPRSRPAKRLGIGLAAVKASYRRYAPVYDMIFGGFLDRGRRAAVQLINGLPPGRVLEVGVGTGLSLPHYDPASRVVGIDLSAEMLDRARERVRRHGLGHIEALEEMDARATPFPDGSFDTVVSMYVLSVTPEPERLLAEMRRLCRPGGSILIVNRFSSTKPLRALVERAAEPFSDAIGFNLQMDWSVLDVLADLESPQVRPVPGLAGASLVLIRNQPRALRAAAGDEGGRAASFPS